MDIDNDALKKAVEALLFITDHALSAEQLAKLTTNTIKDAKRVRGIITELQKELDDRGSSVQLLEIADGFQMGTRPQYAQYVRKLFADRMTMKLSTAAHETLSIIAYKQPLTRAEIEEIRGVEVIAVLEALVEKRLIKVVGRKESVGRPLMYGTTEDFLRHFGLVSLEALPPLDQFSTDPVPTPLATETNAEAWEAAEPAAAEPAAPAEMSAVEEGAHAPAETPAAEAVVEAEPAAEKPKAKNIWADDAEAEPKS